MKKFYIAFAGSEFAEKNTNEYSVFPKTNNFVGNFEGKEIEAAFTSGKGKSAIPNYYLYFRNSEKEIFYFRSTPAEIEIAIKGFVIRNSLPVAEPVAKVAEAETAEAEPAPTPAKRRRAK